MEQTAAPSSKPPQDRTDPGAAGPASPVGVADDFDDEPCLLCGMDRPYHESGCPQHRRDRDANAGLLPGDGCDPPDPCDCDDPHRCMEIGGSDFHTSSHASRRRARYGGLDAGR